MSNELNQRAIIYAAAFASEVALNIPQSIHRECVGLTCGSCKASLLAYREQFAKTMGAAKLASRPVLVLCPTCLPNGTGGGDLIYLHYHDPNLQSLLARHEAEKN